VALAIVLGAGGATAVAGSPAPPAQHLGRDDGRGELALSFDWFEDGHQGLAPRQPPRNGSLGFHATPVWLRFRVVHDGDAPAVRILQLGFMPKVASLYRQESGRLVAVASSGVDRVFAERPVQDTRVSFRIDLQPHQDSTFWLEVRSDEVIWARASLLSEAAYARCAALRNLAQGLYYGVLLAMILYNGFIYLSTRERTYLFYTLFEAAMVLLQASQDKIAFQYLWPRAPAWAARSEQLLAGLTMLGALGFTVAFLDLGRCIPRLAKLLRTLMALAVAVLIASQLTVAPAFEEGVGIFLIVCVVAIAASGAVAAGRGQANARFFVVAWIPLLVGTVLAILGALGLVSNIMAFIIFKVGSAAEATLLALALANRIKLIRRARARADAALLAAKSAHAAALEDRVAARTRELSEALSGLKLTQDKLMRQERLASLAGMVAGMAHEVGNPLNFAQGGAEALGEQLDALEPALSSSALAPVRRALSLVQSGLHRIGRIMTNLNGYMQLRTLETEPTDLVAEIESTLAIVDETLVRRGITVVKRLAALPLFPCRPGELNQVFMNIVLNACGVMSGGGRLEITTRSHPRDGLEIEFADDGPGVSPEHRDAIFEPFFSERAVAGAGSGLGLYIAREIVSRHGGHLLLLDSEQGARFAVRLPPPGGDHHVASA
jgi:signal transduction histidine kinase